VVSRSKTTTYAHKGERLMEVLSQADKSAGRDPTPSPLKFHRAPLDTSGGTPHDDPDCYALAVS
jgi:hypothetical protein